MRLVLLLLILSLGSPGLAAPTVSCHCFRDRQFDPAAPAAADPYLLATNQNTIMAVVYGVEKKPLVRAKMSGTTGVDLWIALELGRLLQRPAMELLEQKATSADWLTLLTEGTAQLPDYLRDVAPVLWGRLIVEHWAVRLFDLDPESLSILEASKATDQELLLAGLLSWRTARPAPALLAQVRSGKQSWGTLAKAAAIDPKQIADLVRVARGR